MPDAKREVDELRQELAKIDAQLLVSLDRRARAARRLGELRKDQAATLPITDHAALRALIARSSGDMPAEALRDILRKVFAECLALELPVKVVYIGPEGGPGHAAARGRFGATAGLATAESIAAALDEVSRRRVEFAVVPFETSAEGPVQATLLALMDSELRVVEVIDSTFGLDLMNRTGNLADVEKVYVTPQDHARCQKLFAGSRFAMVDVKTPVMACQLAAEDHGAAAIANESIGTPQGLEIAKKNVLDGGVERVRYGVVGTRPSGRTGDDVTSIVFSVQDGPGSLLDVLKVFAERGVNLTTILSHPTHGEGWGYVFYVEAAAHFTDRPLVTAFEELKRITRFFRVLGSYPAP